MRIYRRSSWSHDQANSRTCAVATCRSPASYPWPVIPLGCNSRRIFVHLRAVRPTDVVSLEQNENGATSQNSACGQHHSCQQAKLMSHKAACACARKKGGDDEGDDPLPQSCLHKGWPSPIVWEQHFHLTEACAVRTALRSSSPSKGLVRKAEAPAFSAVERISASLFPVTMITRVEGDTSRSRD